MSRLPNILQILRLLANTRKRIKFIPSSNKARPSHGHMVLQPTPVPQHHARMKDTIRADMAISPNLDRWVDDSSWMNLSHKKVASCLRCAAAQKEICPPSKPSCLRLAPRPPSPCHHSASHFYSNKLLGTTIRLPKRSGSSGASRLSLRKIAGVVAKVSASESTVSSFCTV